MMNGRHRRYNKEEGRDKENGKNLLLKTKNVGG
jgi:hypothetical protein